MKSILAVLAFLVVMVTALPILRFDQWWIRIFDFPRVQISIAGILILALFLFYFRSFRFHESLVFGLLVLAVGYQFVAIFPYTMLMPYQVLASESRSDDANLKLLISNVLMENRESKALLKIVHDYDPDVILTMETDEWWENELRVLEERYPHTLKKPLDNTYGMLVHSRLEMISPEVQFIIKESIPSMHMQVVLPSSDRVFLHFVHPDPPNPIYAIETTQRDAELLIIGREVKKHEKPTIIAGDFNDVPWSRTTKLFQKTSGLLDPRIGRGTYSSFNARYPLLRWPLNHIFHSEHFKLVHMEMGPAWGSDHFPIFIELSLDPGTEIEPEELNTSRAEEALVDEKIDEGRQQSNE